MKLSINWIKTTIAGSGTWIWLFIWMVCLGVIFSLNIKNISDPEVVYYIIIVSTLLVSMLIISQIFILMQRKLLNSKEKEQKIMIQKFDQLENLVNIRTKALDSRNSQFEKKSIENEDLNHELKVLRDELGHLVLERTAELEKMTSEMNDNQKALMYLVEDVNDSRNELEGLNKKLNRTVKEAESARDRINAILKSVADGLLVTDFNSKILLMNHVAEDIFDVKSSKVIGENIEEILNINELTGKNWEKFIEEKSSKFDFKKKGKIFNAKTSSIWGSKGFVTGMVIIFRDVTQERELDAAKSEFISTSAHELRTPLTAIRGFSEILLTREKISENEKKKFLGYINKQSISLGKIINDLLDISRIEAGEDYNLKKIDFKPDKVIKEVISSFNEISSGINFVFKGNNEGSVFADKDLFIQVLTNLFSNAVKYSPFGGDVVISSFFEGESYILIVQDHGMGMTEDETKKIFKKFYRVDSTNTAIEGTGLGMGIVKNIVDAHSGEIEIQSEIDVGTKIKIIIPAIELRENIENQKNK